MKNFDYYYSPNYMTQFVRMNRPINQGLIPTPDGERIAYLEFGNPRGTPIVCIHGGPGGCMQPLIDLTFFNLQTQRVILYDQRHCQNSVVHSNWRLHNNTSLLIDDLEQLRRHLNIDSWHVFGGSWGSCLALCYAINYPQSVKDMVLWGILLGRQSCIDFAPPQMLTPMEAYYCQEKFFLPENYIIDNATLLAGKKISIAHGDSDPLCNVENAKELARALNASELFIAEDEGHHPYMPKMLEFLKRKSQEMV